MLCDIGAKKSNICSDITTTFPINGKFTKFQKDIYDVVLASQLAAIESIKPGIEFKEISKISNEKIVEGLLKLGILKGSKEDCLLHRADSIFMPHSLSHYIGRPLPDSKASGRTTWDLP